MLGELIKNGYVIDKIDKFIEKKIENFFLRGYFERSKVTKPVSEENRKKNMGLEFLLLRNSLEIKEIIQSFL